MLGKSLLLGAYDRPLLRRMMTPALDAQGLENLGKFKRIGHVPFVPPFSTCATIGARLTGSVHEMTASSSKVRGFFDKLVPVSDGVSQVRGWAYTDSRPITCIAIANQDMIVRGAAVPGFPRPDVASELRISDGKTGWAGYARLSAEDSALLAYALTDEAGAWYALQNVHHPDREGSFAAR